MTFKLGPAEPVWDWKSDLEVWRYRNNQHNPIGHRRPSTVEPASSEPILLEPPLSKLSINRTKKFVGITLEQKLPAEFLIFTVLIFRLIYTL